MNKMSENNTFYVYVYVCMFLFLKVWYISFWVILEKI